MTTPPPFSSPSPREPARNSLLVALAPLTTERRLEALEFFEERAGVREYCGGATRAAAEADAAAETAAAYAVPWTVRT